jgi:hypothetical protein
MASIRKAKKLAKKQGKVFKAPSSERKKLMNETREMVNKVNKRLRSLEKSGNYNSYASKKLFNRLDTKSINVLNKARNKKILSVKVTRGLTNTQLKAIQKASSQFLRSKTSTAKGIERTREQTKKSMLESLKTTMDSDITKDDIDDYYDMLSDRDFWYFADKLGASTLWQIIDEAKEKNMSESQFISTLELYITIPDEDIRNKAIRLYNKYVV